MPDRTNPPRARTTTDGGILRPEELARHVELRRWPAPPALAAWVENGWSLRWDLPEGRRHLSATLPHPACSLTVERGTHPRIELAGAEVVVTGVVTRRFEVEVRGHGAVVGLKFRPGGLAALTGHSARDWTDRTVPARGGVPDALHDALAGLNLDGSPDDWARTLTALDVDGHTGGRNARYDRVLRVVADMPEDRSVVTVAEAEARPHVSARTLQRDFLHYVGVGPKWVLARYRMHDVVAELDAGHDGSLTELALRHGWYDQAHFTRDFTALVGVPPSRYRSRAAADAGPGPAGS